MLLYLPGEPSAAELGFLERLPELELLDDPLSTAGADPAPKAPPLLVERSLELPIPVAAMPFLLPSQGSIIVRKAEAPLYLEDTPRLLDGDALRAPEFGPEPERWVASAAEARPTRLTLSVVASREALDRPIRALLLLPGDVAALLELRARLPWSVAEQLRLAVFEKVAFLRLEGAGWSLPVGLPYWGDDGSGVYVAQGCALSPEVSLSLARRAAAAPEGQLVFLSPARCWYVDRDAFRPLDTLLELDRTLDTASLRVEASRATVELPAPPPPPAEPKPRRGSREEKPATPQELLAKANALLKAGRAEEAGVMFERAGAYELAAKAYEQAAGAA